MNMESVQPTTPTNTSGQEQINKSNQQGNTVSDGTNERVLMGFQKNGFGDGKDYGLKVSQEGFDVRSASDDELVMSSGFNLFKIVASGSVVPNDGNLNTGGANYGSSSSTVTVAHNLGYVPAVLAFYSIEGINHIILPYTNIALPGGASFYQYSISAEVDSTNIYIVTRMWGLNVNASFDANAVDNTVKYYLLRETAN